MAASAPDHTNSKFSFIIDTHQIGHRLDQTLAVLLSDQTRSQIARWIDNGSVRVNGEIRKRSCRLNAGDRITGTVTPPVQPVFEAEPISLEVLFEDEHICVINKPPDMVVHPAPGNYRGTLVNGLLHRFKTLKEATGDNLRPGIVHRLDKDTSGVIVVAKHLQATEQLSKAFKARQVRKKYLALVRGCPAHPKGTLTGAIGRHPNHRKRMAIIPGKGRAAITHWRCLKNFSVHAGLLEITLKTGRTHQIRVHCADMGHPVMGDTVYGGKHNGRPRTISISVERQMLHAWKLGFTHPITGRALSFKASLPHDFRRVLKALASK